MTEAQFDFIAKAVKGNKTFKVRSLAGEEWVFVRGFGDKELVIRGGKELAFVHPNLPVITSFSQLSSRIALFLPRGRCEAFPRFRTPFSSLMNIQND